MSRVIKIKKISSISQTVARWKRQNYNIVVITSCSSKKLNENNIPAERLYQGQLFKSIRKYTDRNGFDLMILSSKYGLIPNNQIISHYDKYITECTRDVQFQEKVHQQFAQIDAKYDRFIVIMGENYRFFLKQYYDKRFLLISDNRGIGGYKQIVHQLLLCSEKTQIGAN